MAETPWRARLPRWSVRFRILASILAVTAIGMAVAGGTTFLVQRERTLNDIDERLVSRIELARFVVTGESTAQDGSSTRPATANAANFTTSAAALEAVLARVIPGRNESSLGIVDGVATYISGVAMDFHLEDDPLFVERVTNEVADGSVGFGTALSPLGQLRYIATPVVVVGSPAERGVYVTAVDVDAELEELTSSFFTYTIAAAIALIAIALIGWFVAGRLLRPIRQLRAAASRITATDLNERLPVRGRDDVSELTETVNGMLDRLSDSMTSQRRLLDDVRHELKTPITIVRGHLELLDSANSDDVEAVRALSIDELDRMAGLVDDIESFAEVQHTNVSPQPVDVADFTREVYGKVLGIAGHDWVLGTTSETIVNIDSARLTQAWLQLADNAAKYSPAGSAVTIGSTVVEAEVEFWVLDNGTGIPPEAEERIFERFGRVDTGRGIRGSGLGLPIVKAIAEAHDGRVTVESSTSGSRFAIVVPRAPRSDSAHEEVRPS
ncbi:MAG: HAMP domain-containing histidine kinase [Salinibacterium sp.]|nr:HAMP domain-containing histidine kinase [Salinibacterium sp.]